MITRAEVDKLLSTRAAQPMVVSLYVAVPLDPAALRGLPARAGELLAAAERFHSQGASGARVRDEDRYEVRNLLEQHGRECLGHTVAIFVCGQLGLSELISLPSGLGERGVLSTRPHVRPLLLALQRWPAYHVAVVDRRHAWVFKVAGERIDAIAQPVGQGVRSRGFGGWYGLEAYRIHERVIQLTRHHYRETAAILERAMRSGEQQPLVLGGHEENIPQFLAVLPADLRDRFAGSFVTDPHTMTPARVRELAGPVIERWADLRARQMVAQLPQMQSAGPVASGLQACVAAVNQHAVALLFVPDDGLVPGAACQGCGALAAAGEVCPHCGAALRPVADLVEEVVIKTMEDGGQVQAVPDPPDGIAARLRFPVDTGDER